MRQCTSSAQWAATDATPAVISDAERREQHRGSDDLPDRRHVREHAALEQDQRERDRSRVAHQRRVVEVDAARAVLAEQHPQSEEQQQGGGPEPIDEARRDGPDQQHRDRDEQGLWDVQRCLLVRWAGSMSPARRRPRPDTVRSVLLAYIPSPSSRFLVDSGPLHIRWYGLLLALGVLIGCRDRAARDGASLDRPRPHVRGRALGRPVRARRRPPVPRRDGLVDALRRPLGAHPAGLGGRSRHLRGAVRRHARRRRSRPAATASRCRSCSTASRRVRRSHRRSDASATTSTRSSSAARRGCPGGSRSRCRTARPATRSTRPSSRRSCTSRSGASSWARSSCTCRGAPGDGCRAERCSACTSRSTRRGASSSRGCGSIPRTRSGRCG